MNMKPATIKASEWATIADAVKRGEVTARDAYAWIILERVHETPLDPLFMEFKERDSMDGEEAIMTQKISDEFTLTWHDTKPASELDALLATKPSALDSVLKSALNYEQPHYELVDQAQSELADLRTKLVALEMERDGWREKAVAMRETLQGVFDKHHIDKVISNVWGRNIDEVVADYVDYLKQS